jgi:hypothetical protein
MASYEIKLHPTPEESLEGESGQAGLVRLPLVSYVLRRLASVRRRLPYLGRELGLPVPDEDMYHQASKPAQFKRSGATKIKPYA